MKTQVVREQQTEDPLSPRAPRRRRRRNADKPGRDPYREVKLQLRQEVGFCCPMDGCGNPYLTWHHFDPPWRVKHHHRPEGMIALCREHADKADNGSYTDDQLRALKRAGRERGLEVRGRFDWMRHDLLAVVGGILYLRPNVIFQISDVRCIWFSRDDEGYLLLNLNMPSLSDKPRLSMENNFWSASPTTYEVIAPPSGRLVEVRYSDDDFFRIEFFSLGSQDAFVKRYPDYGEILVGQIPFPVTVVEISEKLTGAGLELGPKHTRIPGNNIFFGALLADVEVGFSFEVDQMTLKRLFPNG